MLIVRRDGSPVRVLAGSTNFSLRGLYIQANNALLFDDADTAAAFAEAFEQYWSDPKRFRNAEIANEWRVVRNQPGSRISLCFSPHSDAALSLIPIAEAIANAETSVLYSIVFLSQLTGTVRDEFEELMQRTLFPTVSRSVRAACL